MAAPTNTVTTEQMQYALNVEVATKFDQSVDKLAELFGVVAPETMAAGSKLTQYTVSGTLQETVAEGEEVPFSQYKENATEVGSVTLNKYRKLTTAEAILKSGYEHAITRTDEKMAKDARAGIIKKFYEYLANGTGTATGTNFQIALANADAVLDNALEANSDSTEGKLYFINTLDRAKWLGEHEITGAQTAFGMTFIEGFLGLNGTCVFTSRVPQGTFYVTPKENLHIYVPDISALNSAGFGYTVSDSGALGVYHDIDRTHVSAETGIVTGAAVIAEAVNYIVKGTIATTA